ncbi:hypothetical protein [Sporomusa acidovorans]|uniref:Uncharacterized protein n=1 Tax=Sporomusa acidovorans (strain ATCC 49682 / DSM 3132 / Mol) TaxID=1123286 RepID=A0ABZ3J4Y8_SPOA4|nr:hypothetical protein [Sporomusa acidovorans]OZC15525.1 hypothetical protein SPACI_48290 [Sporomusa acidovorans DSM 3132]SDE17080.1 hypothetical protein SAMN04488499_100958 [Sporomusa acidovorans]
MECEIIYKTTGERWGIFPRDIGEFQARIKDTIIKKSAKIEIMSCSFTPDEKNNRHQKALAGLVDQLTKAGWEQLPAEGEAWYNLRFYKRTV